MFLFLFFHYRSYTICLWCFQRDFCYQYLWWSGCNWSFHIRILLLIAFVHTFQSCMSEESKGTRWEWIEGNRDIVGNIKETLLPCNPVPSISPHKALSIRWKMCTSSLVRGRAAARNTMRRTTKEVINVILSYLSSIWIQMNYRTHNFCA